jgi:hypothetical protein
MAQLPSLLLYLWTLNERRFEPPQSPLDSLSKPNKAVQKPLWKRKLLIIKHYLTSHVKLIINLL